MDSELASDSRKCADLMCQCCSRLCRVMNSVLVRTEVNMSQCHVLGLLSRLGEVKMGELAGALGVTLGAATSMVDRLLALDLVSRKHDPSDRRVVKVHLTTKGTETLECDMTNFADFWSAVLEDIPPDRRQAFFEVYERMLQVAEERIGK